MFTTYHFIFFDLSFLISAKFWLGYLVISLITGFALVLYSLIEGGPEGRHARARMIGSWSVWKVFAVYTLGALLWWLSLYWFYEFWREQRRLNRLKALLDF